MIWRKQPPTVDEIRGCRYWWYRTPNAEPIILDLFVGRDGKIQDRLGPLDFTSWPSENEWAKCPPPDDADA